MPRKLNFIYSVLNITLHPHSPEIYANLFHAACAASETMPIKYHGDEHIDLREISLEGTPDINFNGIAGYINKYSPIGDTPWFDRKKGVPLPEGEEPDFDRERYCPHFSQFQFLFFPDGHRLFIITSIQGTRLSPAYIAKSLENLFKRPEIFDRYGSVAVNVEMSRSGIEAILRIQRLEKLMIRLTLPNGDDLTELEQEWMDKLEKQNVAKIQEVLTAQRDKNLTPDDTTLALMNLAQSNGYIWAEGITNSEKVKLKSSEFPVEYRSNYIEGESLFRKFIESAKTKLLDFISRKNR